MPGRALFVTTAVAAVLAFSSAAQAGIVSFAGTTAGGPTYNRPLDDLSGLSAVGTAVRYGATRVNVSVTGDYTFLTAARFDNFATLYGPTFNPVAPLTNALIANDDLVAPPFNSSGFAYSLTAGTDYFFVNTGFANTDFGAFASTVGGPGVITTTPPASIGTLPDGLFVLSDTTAGGPTFTRPLEDGSGLSAVGVGVRYDRFDFTVGTAGDYTFLTTGLFDTFSILYGPGFNPGSPLTSFLAANDDIIAPPFTTSGFAATLMAGVTYSLITTGFAPTDFGAFDTLISGAGAIRPIGVAVVPEPDTVALLFAGVALMGWAARRRRA